MSKPTESDLYPAIKAFLEGQGYEVKSEIGAADVVGVRGDEAPVIVEMKIGFSLTLFHQAVARQSLSEKVYIAVPHGKGKAFQKSLRNNKGLCRRLGLGLMTVRLKEGVVTAYADPAPYRPRMVRRKADLLLSEFSKRTGDPNAGGAARRQGSHIVTAYRQGAVKCAEYLLAHGPTKAATVAGATGVEVARRTMADNHYGWFERTERGIYGLTAEGRAAITPQ